MEFVAPSSEKKSGNIELLNIVCMLPKIIRNISVKPKLTAPEATLMFEGHICHIYVFP